MTHPTASPAVRCPRCIELESRPLLDISHYDLPCGICVFKVTGPRIGRLWPEYAAAYRIGGLDSACALVSAVDPDGTEHAHALALVPIPSLRKRA